MDIGAYDGIARIWSSDDSIQHRTLIKHQAPIFVLKWNPDGDTLVSGGVDKYVVVWEPSRGRAKFQLDLHTAATLDIDWQSTDVFASCSSDKQIKVCEIDEDSFSVLKTFHVSYLATVKYLIGTVQTYVTLPRGGGVSKV